MSAAVDLHDWLAARREALRKRLPGVDALTVDLWESGVVVQVGMAGRSWGLRFQAGGEGGWARTASTSIVVDLGGAPSLPREVERVLRAVVGVVDQIDHGGLVVRFRPTIVESPREADRDGALAALPSRDLSLVGLACVADTCAMTRAWGLDGAVVTRLDDRLDDAARQAWLDELRAAPPDVLHVQLDRGIDDPASLEFLARAHAIVPRLRVGAPLPEGPLPDLGSLGVEAWITFDDRPPAPGLVRVVVLDKDGLERLRHLGGPVLAVPPPWSSPDADAPDLLEVGAALEGARGAGLDVEVAGLPECVAPSVPRRREPLAEVALAPAGTVHTPVCLLCSRREACPGVDRAAWERWGMRGLFPEVEAA